MIVQYCRFPLTILLGLLLSLIAVAAFSGGRGEGERGAFPQTPCPQLPALRWKAAPLTALVGEEPSNVVATPTSVIAAFGATLVAVAPDTGNLRWSLELKSAPVGYLQLLDGQLIIVQSEGQVLALNPEDGKTLWKTPLDSSVTAPPFVVDRFLFFATRGNTVQTVERKTGKITATIAVPNRIEASPIIRGNEFILCFNDGKIRRVELKGTTPVDRWAIALPNGYISSNPATDGRLLWLATTTSLVAVDPYANERKALWITPVTDLLPETPTVDGEKLYVATKSGKLLAFHARTGKELWARPASADAAVTGGISLPAAPLKNPFVFGNHLVIPMEGGQLGVFTKDTGALAWIYAISAATGQKAAVGLPAVDGASLYLAASDGAIYRFSTAAQDVDPPTFTKCLPRRNEANIVDPAAIKFVGAMVHDEGSGLLRNSITLTLDGFDLTKHLRLDPQSGYSFVQLDERQPLGVGMHRVVMTARDFHGNLGTLNYEFLAAPTALLVPVTINAAFLPRTLRVPAGTVVVWQNDSGAPRTIINERGLFASDTYYPDGIPQGESWAWAIPTDLQPGAKLYYYCRLRGKAGDGADYGPGLTGLIEIVKRDE